MGKNMQYRQGDVLITEIDGHTEGFSPVPRENDRVVLAHGEATGHAHAIASREATLYERGEERRLLMRRGASLAHEEHREIPLRPRVHDITRQEEYVEGEIQRVAD